MRGHLRLAASAVCAILWADFAQADELSGICRGPSAIGGAAHLCPARSSVQFVSTGPDTFYAVRVLNPATACADVRYVIRRESMPFRRDASSAVTTSYRLQPGQSQTLQIGRGFDDGQQRLQLAAVMFSGQCTGRAAMSWRALVSVTRDMRS